MASVVHPGDYRDRDAAIAACANQSLRGQPGNAMTLKAAM